jgi:RNA polymerase sigma-70 factor (ECF subfamily)
LSDFERGNLKKFSDEELMSLVKTGREMAFEELYQRYSKRMLFYFHRNFYGDGEKAQDFLQDLFLKIIEKSNYFDVNKKFSTWIYTLASNLCKNEFRKNAVRSLMPKIITIEPYRNNLQHNHLAGNMTTGYFR